MKVLVDRFRFGDLEVLPTTVAVVRTLLKHEVAALLKTEDLAVAIESEQVARHISEVFGVSYPTHRPILRVKRGDILFVIESRKKDDIEGLSVFEVVVC